MKKLKLEDALNLICLATDVICPELGGESDHVFSPYSETFLELEGRETDARAGYWFMFLKEDNQEVFVEGNLMTLIAAATGESEQRHLRLELLAPLDLEAEYYRE